MKDTNRSTCPECGHRTKLPERGYACREITEFANCSSNCEHCTCKNDWHYAASPTVATFCVSKQQVEALAKALLHRGDNLGGYERKKPDDIRHGDIWCVERILKDAGIPYEQA